MRQILLGTAAIGLALALTANVNAGGSHGQSSSGHGSVTHAGKGNDYHLSHGTRLKDGGYSYKGKDHSHWTHRYWFGKYGCYTYFCPSTSCWYYWYERESCYYPVSYLPTYTPTPLPTPVSVPSGVTQIVNVNNNSPSSAVGDPPGLPAPPVVPGPSGPPMPPGK